MYQIKTKECPHMHVYMCTHIHTHTHKSIESALFGHLLLNMGCPILWLIYLVTHHHKITIFLSQQIPIGNSFLIRSGSFYPLLFVSAGILYDLNLCRCCVCYCSLCEFIRKSPVITITSISYKFSASSF